MQNANANLVSQKVEMPNDFFKQYFTIRESNDLLIDEMQNQFNNFAKHFCPEYETQELSVVSGKDSKEALFIMPTNPNIPFTCHNNYATFIVDNRILGLTISMIMFSNLSFHYHSEGKEMQCARVSQMYHNLRNYFYDKVDEYGYEDNEPNANYPKIEPMCKSVFRITD